jgi:hypothetical protein
MGSLFLNEHEMRKNEKTKGQKMISEHITVELYRALKIVILSDCGKWLAMNDPKALEQCINAWNK